MADVKLSEIMKKRQTLSFEVFPPKTEKGMGRITDTLSHLYEFSPDYISCTYGAGGSNARANLEICHMIREAGYLPVTHYSVIRNTREKMREHLEKCLDEGVDHVLAVRGDIPEGETTTCGDFDYSSELIAFIRKEFGDRFEIAAGGSPEGHVSCRSLEADIAYLKMKQDNGADYIITQICWDMEQFKRWLDEIRKAGITIPVDVGVMPVLDQATTVNMALSRNGCVMEHELSQIISRYWIFPNPFAPKDEDGNYTDKFYAQKKEDFKKAGIEYTIRQIDRYRACGVQGIHLYSLNKWKDISYIVKEAGLKTIV